MREYRKKCLAIILALTGLVGIMEGCKKNDEDIFTPEIIEYIGDDKIDSLLKKTHKYVESVENYQRIPNTENRIQTVLEGCKLLNISEEIFSEKINADFVNILNDTKDEIDTLVIDEQIYNTYDGSISTDMDKNARTIVKELADLCNWHGDGSNEKIWTNDTMTKFIRNANEAYYAIGAIVNSDIGIENKININLNEKGKEYIKKIK